MAWVGTGIIYTIGGGVLKSEPISAPRSLTNRGTREFTFVQISDSHIGCKHDPNNDVTDDAAQALSYLKRFGSVTVMNGHIHQTMPKVEGNITFRL